MSSVATAPGGAPSRSRPATRLAGLRPRSLSADLLVGGLVAAALALVSFLAAGGTDLATNTWVQAGLVLVGALAAVAVVLRGAAGPAWGAGALLLFAALAALTYASIAWSVQPALSWLEANRTLSYFASFALALIAARLFPARWRGLLGGVAVATTVVSAWAMLVKVFPATLDPLDSLGRLSLPFGYWNATGLIAALGIPACLWAGARQERAPVLRALAAPAIAILVAALVLSYSRGAIAAAVIGTGLWFVLVPLRLRGALVLLIGGAGGAAISGWALATHGISADGVALMERTNAGHSFGLVLLVVLTLTLIGGLVAAFAVDRFALAPALRRRIGTVLIGAAALLPVAGVVALAASTRGLTGEVSHVWNALTNPNAIVGDRPGRLVDLSNSRPHYWGQALRVGQHHLLGGVGAVGFATAASHNASGAFDSRHAYVGHAHGYLFQTFADFGLIGLAVTLALLVAWAAAAARSLGVRAAWGAPQTPRPPPSAADCAERIGLLTLLTVAVIFGLHSLIDWTWFIPGTASVGLACAGWLAGRGPLTGTVGLLGRRRQLTRSPSAAIGLASIVVIALAATWVTVQPLRASDAYDAGVAAAIRGDAATALTDARAAAADDPVWSDPLNLEAKVYAGLGDLRAARHELVEATSRQPSNPAVWEALACYDRGQRDPAAAADFRRALALDPGNRQMRTDPHGFCVTLPGVILGNG